MMSPFLCCSLILVAPCRRTFYVFDTMFMFFAFVIYSIPHIHFGNRLNLMTTEREASQQQQQVEAGQQMGQMTPSDSLAVITASGAAEKYAAR